MSQSARQTLGVDGESTDVWLVVVITSYSIHYTKLYEYAFPFLADGEFGELEGIAHRGDFDLRSHMEGKLDEKSCPLTVELGPDGKPKYRGSGRDLTYRDEVTNSYNFV